MRNNSKRQRSSTAALTHNKDNGRPRVENEGPLLFGHPWCPEIQWGKWSQMQFKMLQLAWFKSWQNDKEIHKPEAKK